MIAVISGGVLASHRRGVARRARLAAGYRNAGRACPATTVGIDGSGCGLAMVVILGGVLASHRRGMARRARLATG
ncbi:hypothetical protein ACIGCO_00675 [Serratia sp. NPDC078756]|uniref:hypothetical protein n=1 Tax=Serratia sp. NPDC078756 TaxID=3364515 RepID=UPI0037D7A0B3